MKRTLLLAALSWLVGAPPTYARSDLETLRSLCAEQERQIRQLEDENAKLRSMNDLPAKSGGAKATRLAQPPTVGAAAVSSSAAKAGNIYTVGPNDSLERISRKLGITPAALAGMNGLNATSTLREGQKLKVPGTSTVASTAPAAAPKPMASATPKPAAAGASSKTHEVKARETFSSIGRKYGIPTATLIAANPGIKPATLRPGQIINLSKPTQTADAPEKTATPEKAAAAEKAAPEKERGPVTSKQASPAPTASTTPVLAHKAPSPAEASAKSLSSTSLVVPVAAQASAPSPSSATLAAKPPIRSVTTDGATTYGEFAEKHGTSINRLNDLNALDLVEATVLAKGSELYIPARP